MAIYAWFGGHTGWIGANSGYTAQYGGPSGSAAWISPLDGTVSLSGDRTFGPYFWGNSSNWRRVTTIGSTYYYDSTSNTPQGGDTVWISNSYPTNTLYGQTTPSYGVSLLYGGMSGDGFTASGQTGWYGATGAQNGTTGNPQTRYKDITFNVGWQAFNGQLSFYPDPDGARNRYGWNIRTGEIGQGATSSGSESGLTALNIRTSYFQLNEGPATTTTSYRGHGYGPSIVVKNLSNSAGLTAPRFTSQNSNWQGLPQYSMTYLLGNWPLIYQGVGSLVATQSTISATNGSWYTSGAITKMQSTNTNKTKFYTLSHYYMAEDASIWGTYSATAQAKTSAVVTVNGYSGSSSNHAVTLGSLHEGTQPIFSIVTLNAATGNSPYIKFGAATVNAMLGNGGTITVHENAAMTDRVTIRDGYLRDGNLLMYHPVLSGWQNFKLGDPSSPSDPGIRIDSSNVDVRCFNGQTLVTQAGLQAEVAYAVDVDETVLP